MATKNKPITCIDVPNQNRQTWLDQFLYFIREGDEIRIEMLNNVSGRVFAKSTMSVHEFNLLATKLLIAPGD